MAEDPDAYPLHWPSSGWPRTPNLQRKPARFGQASEGVYRHVGEIEWPVARDRLERELRAIGISQVVLSSNLEMQRNGMPRAGRRRPDDPGVALYFQLRGKPIVFACDRWNTVAANIAALAAHLQAMRGMERWGVGSVEQLFTGYTALPGPMVPGDWRVVLQEPASIEAAESTYRQLIRAAHPDQPGGSHAKAAGLNAAIAEARRHFAQNAEKPGDQNET